MKLVHFQNLKDDLEGQMRAIADFLEIDIDEARWHDMAEHCTFPWMKAHADKSAPLGGAVWNGGAATFINKGTNGRWSGQLSDGDCRAYDARARAELGEDCARWLMTGKM